MIKIIENYLPEEDFKRIIDVVEAERDFAWYLGKQANEWSEDPRAFYFKHSQVEEATIQYDGAISFVETLLRPLKKKVKVHRCKTNLFIKQPEPIEMGFHTDYDTHEISTLLLYLQDSNGYTEFEKGKKIESIKNRAVIFPSNLKHQSVSQTDTMFRTNINLNFEEMNI